MKYAALILTAALLGLSHASAQNVLWNYTGLGAAPATDDKLFLYDTSATASKTLTIANLFTSPTLVTPTIGVATATSINGLTLTASTGTLTIANGKTLTASNTLTFTGTDSTSFTFPATSNTVFTSTLSTNDVSAANSIWGASNSLVFEGATANAFELTLTLTDPTADMTVTLPNFAVDWTPLGSTLTTNNIDAANSIWAASNALVLEGATANGFELTLSPVDPTADATISIPNFAVNWALLGSTLTTNTVDAANSIWGVSNGLVFEGATADTSETTISVTDPTADRAINFPDAPGTVILAQTSTTSSLTADNQTVTPGANNRIQLASDNATATNRTFALSATGAITGQIYILVGPSSNACELADTGIQKLNGTWTPGANDTLTLHFDGTNYNEVCRSDN